jgi:hypothetical protein
MSLNTKQARKAAAVRWRNRPIVVCAACGKKHRCVIVPASSARPQVTLDKQDARRQC